jgi:hypothetical protein
MVVAVAAFSVLAQGFTTGGQASVGAQHATTAVTLASRVMADLESGERAVDSGSTGTFEDEPDFSWTVKSDVDDPGLRLLTVEVAWTERGESRVYALSRLFRERTRTPGERASSSEAQPPGAKEDSPSWS